MIHLYGNFIQLYSSLLVAVLWFDLPEYSQHLAVCARKAVFMFESHRLCITVLGELLLFLLI